MSALMSAQGLPEIALDGTQRPLQQWHTAQGSKVCFVASAGAPMFDLQLRFKAGACHDGDTPGLAALTLYMLDQGGGQWDAAQIGRANGMPRRSPSDSRPWVPPSAATSPLTTPSCACVARPTQGCAATPWRC